MSSSISINDLPYMVRIELCKLLNTNGEWKKLADILLFHNDTINILAKENNPANELFNLLEASNRTVSELFILLYRIKNRESMKLLISFVDKKYHVLLHNLGNNVSQKDVKCSKIKEQQNDKSNTFSSSLPKISFNELVLATNNWEDNNFLGQGGFAVVYKGNWKNTEVAVKKIIKNKKKKNHNNCYNMQLEQSFREIKVLSSLTHVNILPLYGYSVDGPAPCLVYEYMENGSLDDRLCLINKTAPLSWFQRGEIAKGVALGLQYLHTAHPKPMIHQDIKSANILLDKNFVPKIGDFGLVKEGSANGSLKVNKIQGTRGYLPEDYITSKNLNTKVDTYSFGVVLFEIATGIGAYNIYKTKNKSLPDYIESFDESNKNQLKDDSAGEANIHVFFHLIKYGKWCTHELAERRPEMKTVYEKLKNL